jgi:PPOX class probable F420-dependent enzyme
VKLMSAEEWRAFVLFGTRTAKLATVRRDGRPHIAPVWFDLEGEELFFTTGRDTVKGKNLLREPRVMLSVDDERPPFSFVLVEGRAQVTELAPADLLPWCTRLARRYMGAAEAEAYGRRNAVEGELLVRVPLTKVVAQQGVAD